jgi:hemerythrin-like domain-containing protein
MAEAIVSPVEALRQAHMTLLVDLQDLEGIARMVPTGGPTTLFARLIATRDHLATHFRFEEKDGYMDAVRKREPHFEHAVSRLGIEHGQIMQSLDGLVNRASRVEVPDDRLRQDVLHWLDRLRNHEHRENELVQEALNTDFGAGD